MACAQNELNSFVGKFVQLCAYRFNADHLELSSSDGNIVVNLKANVGTINPL